MSNDTLVVVDVDHAGIADTTFELLSAARKLAAGRGGQVAALLIGEESLAASLLGADVVYVSSETFSRGYSAESYERALLETVRSADPSIVLFSTATMGIDLAGSLSVAWDAPLVSYVVGLELEGDLCVATSQVYGGKLLAEVAVAGPHAIFSVTAGAFRAEPSPQGQGSPQVIAVTTGGGDLRSHFVALHEPETGGVDITLADLLVSVGRGIASKDNLEVVQELADALGVPLAASRPVIDQGWLSKPHQVGKSGKKVTPRAYLAFGISGAPEHIEGMRAAELIIACNTDPNAPIFEVAHYGSTADLFDLVPALVEAVQG